MLFVFNKHADKKTHIDDFIIQLYNARAPSWRVLTIRLKVLNHAAKQDIDPRYQIRKYLFPFKSMERLKLT